MDKRFAVVEVKDGRVVNASDLAQYLSKLKNGKYWIRARSQKSVQDNQRGLYRVWLAMLWEAYGIDPDDLHEFFKYKYVPLICEDATGSTENLKKDEYAAYMTLVQNFARDFLGFDLPDGQENGN